MKASENLTPGVVNKDDSPGKFIELCTGSTSFLIVPC